jgi:hypothetical protein
MLFQPIFEKEKAIRFEVAVSPCDVYQVVDLPKLAVLLLTRPLTRMWWKLAFRLYRNLGWSHFALRERAHLTHVISRLW